MHSYPPCTMQPMQRNPEERIAPTDNHNMSIGWKITSSLDDMLIIVSNILERPRSAARRLRRSCSVRKRFVQDSHTSSRPPTGRSECANSSQTILDSVSHVDTWHPGVSLRSLGDSLARTQRRVAFLLRSCKSSKEDLTTESLERHQPTQGPSGRADSEEEMAAVDTRRPSTRPGPPIGGPISGMLHRPSLAENVRTASQVSHSSATSNSSTSTVPGVGEERPLASGNGVSLSIALAEPVLFLQGFDQSELGNQTTALLRGSFHLRVSKTAKIKTISLAFRGKAETDWPEGKSSTTSRIRSNKL